MVIVSVLYLLAVYLIFLEFKLLPWNGVSKGIVLVLGVIILSGFLVGLQGLTPASTQAVISGFVTEIAPQVSGRVIEVPAEPNVELTTPRLGQAETLAATGAGSTFEVEQYQSRVAGVLAQLESAQYDLENTEVRAPGLGLVTMFVLRAVKVGLVLGITPWVIALVWAYTTPIGAAFGGEAKKQ